MDDIDMYELQAKRGPRREADAGRGTAPGAVREGQRPGHRRAGPGRPHHRAGRQDQDVPHPCGQQAGGHDPQLRGHPPCALRDGRLRPGLPGPAQPGPVAQRRLDARLQQEQARRPGHARPRRKWPAGSRATRCCSTARCSPAATRRTSASRTCWPRARSCRWTSPTASSTTSARSIRSRDEAVGPAGPTTATRMDRFTEMMLAQTGLIAMIGKAERGPVAIEAIKKHKSAYLMAVGGAAYLVSKAIKTGQGASASPTWAWKPSTSSTWSTCRSRWRWTPAAPAPTSPARPSGKRSIASGEFKTIPLVARLELMDSADRRLRQRRRRPERPQGAARRAAAARTSSTSPTPRTRPTASAATTSSSSARARSSATCCDEHGVKALVVACNTATAAAIHLLRREYPELPLVGVEPALKPAASRSRTGRIGVLATRGTLASAQVRRAARFAARTRPSSCLQPCDGLAAAIESGRQRADRCAVRQVHACHR